MIVAKWNSRSVTVPTLSRGLLLFIANHFGLQEDTTKSVTLFTQYKHDDTLFHCHTNDCGGLPWYDWVMMLYSDPNHPGQQFSCPARLMAVVKDDNDPNGVYHPILQWADNRTMRDSVLFDEYVFNHDLNPDEATSFHVHLADSIERPIFVIECESETEKKILVANDPETWATKFHKIL